MDATRSLPTFEEFEALPREQRKEIFERLIDTVQKLSERVERLEAQAAKTSANSSKPPSSDGLKKPLRTTSSRAPSGKKPGGQPGRSGASLKQVDCPDVVVIHPASSCGGCGQPLADAPVDGIEARQVFDLPPLKLVVTEHRAERKTCACGCVTTAAFPPEATAPVQYGPWIQSLVVYLSVYQFVPYGRMKDFFSELFGAQISPATMKRILALAQSKTASTVEQIKQAIIGSALAHFDETGMRVAKSLRWLHSASTESLAHFAVSRFRGAKAMLQLGILPKFRGKAVHDAWAPYYSFEDCIHFLCNAHHLRELRFVFEQLGEKWARRMHDHLLKMHRAVFKRRRAGHEGLAARVRAKFEADYVRILAVGKRLHWGLESLEQKGSRGRRKQRPGKNLLDRLDRNRDQVLGFMRDFGVPFTNNLAEGDIRMNKVKQKISGCFRTEGGAGEFAHLRSYIATARKQGHSALGAIHAALAGRPLRLA